jgi:hypothetical protein
MLFLIALFLLPVAARAAVFVFSDHPRSFRDTDWSSIGSLPPASQHPAARVLVLSGRTGGWKGVLAVHSWIVVKRENATRWTRFDVVGWGNPVRVNGWAPDGRWFGSQPIVVADVQGKEAEWLIPKIEAAVKEYRFANAGDYRVWPGPNSNTFTATIMRAVPELATALPLQRHRPRLPHRPLPRHDRQRHRLGAQSLGAPGLQDRLGGGRRDQLSRTCRWRRSSASGPQAARLRPPGSGRLVAGACRMIMTA